LGCVSQKFLVCLPFRSILTSLSFSSSISAAFGRPLLITEKNAVPLPNPRVDQPVLGREVLSAATVVSLEYQLWTYLVQAVPTDGATSMSSKLEFVSQWIHSLPDVFRVKNPDTSLDADHPMIIFQRAKLHCMGYSARLAFLRSYLARARIRTVDPESGNCVGDEYGRETDERISFAIDTCIELMSSSKSLYTLCFPDKAKYFMVSFCPFDTASVLCSALMNDIGDTHIPRRLEIVQAIGCALYIANSLRGLAKLGAAMWIILSKLVSKLNLSDGERQTLKRSSTSGWFGANSVSELETTRSGSTVDSNVMDRFSGGNNAREYTAAEAQGYFPETDVANENIWHETSDTTALESQLAFGDLEGEQDWDELILSMTNPEL
jgi:hypothetical protein